MFESRDIISITDLSREEIEAVIKKSDEMNEALQKGENLNIMKGRIMTTLFFEPSTRTRLSFSSAMQRLGGTVIDLGEIKASSIVKGESLADTIRMVERYSDLIVVRHPKDGSSRFVAEISKKPVINGGDGTNQHPTQTLVDLFSIKKFKGTVENLNVTMLGDLKHARVIKSLAYGLALFKANLTLVSPAGLELEKEIVAELKDKFGIKIIQTNDVYTGVRNADVLYVTRIQKERFSDPYEAEKMQKSYKITPEMLEQSRDDMILMHALPRVDEIDYRLDGTKVAKYFEEASFGVPVRMAIISMVVQ